MIVAHRTPRAAPARTLAVSSSAVVAALGVGSHATEPAGMPADAPAAPSWALVGVDASDDPSFVVIDDSGAVVESHPMVGAAGDKVAVGRLGDADAVYSDVVPGWVGIVRTGEAGGVEDLGEWVLGPVLLAESPDVLVFASADVGQNVVAPGGTAVSLESDDRGDITNLLAAGTVIAVGRTSTAAPSASGGPDTSSALVDLAEPGTEVLVDGAPVALGPNGIATAAGSDVIWWNLDGERLGSAARPAGELVGLADGSLVAVSDDGVVRLAFGEAEPVPVAERAPDASDVSVVALGGERWAVLERLERPDAGAALDIHAVVGDHVVASATAPEGRVQGPAQHDDRCLLVGEFEQTLIDVESGDVTTLADGGTLLARSDDGCTVAVRGTSDHLLRGTTEVNVDGLILAVSADGRLVLTRSEDGSTTTVVDVDTGDSVDVEVDADVGQFTFVAAA